MNDETFRDNELKSPILPRAVLLINIFAFLKNGSLTLDCPLSKGNQAPHPKFARPNGKILNSKFFLTSVKNWCVQLT